jgi:hypothetical protein
MELQILSWNTLEYDGAWSEQWGCPLELARRDERLELHPDWSLEDAQAVLSRERYQRIQATILEELLLLNEDHPPPDLVLFQEISSMDAWTDNITIPSNTYQRVECATAGSASTMQQIYIRSDAGWNPKQSYPLASRLLEGGCLVEFQYESTAHDEDEDDSNTVPSMYLVNLHGQARVIRNPEERTNAWHELWNELADRIRLSNNNETTTVRMDPPAADDWQDSLIMCGDWNMHLPDLLSDMEFELEWPNATAATLDNDTHSSFSTNHETGFLAQYDGCWVGADWHVERVQRNTTGFMPKGQGGRLGGLFSYNNSGGVYSNGTLVPHTQAVGGMSDHLRIYTHVTRAVPTATTTRTNQTNETTPPPSESIITAAAAAASLWSPSSTTCTFAVMGAGFMLLFLF